MENFPGDPSLPYGVTQKMIDEAAGYGDDQERYEGNPYDGTDQDGGHDDGE